MPDLKALAKSLKIGWVKRYLEPENRAKWKQIIAPVFTISEGVSIFQCNSDEKQISRRVTNVFWRETAVAWNEIAHEGVVTPGDVLNEVIWLNKNIRAEENPGIRQSICISKGVIKVEDLYDRNERKMLSANALAVKVGMHPMMCQSLIRKIPQEWRELLNRGERVVREERKNHTRDYE